MSKLFAQNLGTVDRIARFAIGLGLLSLTVVGPHTLWGLVGIVPLVTASIGSCPAYTLFGFGTRKAQQDAGPTHG